MGIDDLAITDDTGDQKPWFCFEINQGNIHLTTVALDLKLQNFDPAVQQPIEGADIGTLGVLN